MEHEFISKLKEIEKKLDNVSNQMQELREAIRGAPNQDEELQMPEFYEHPWYKYKRELINTSGDNFQPQGSDSTTSD
tara:strand:+ start:85 stop:315 length:231 start_codon:yes stop_codon:yes gene_type:complete